MDKDEKLNEQELSTIAILRDRFPGIASQSKDSVSFVKNFIKNFRRNRDLISLHELGIPFERIKKMSRKLKIKTNYYSDRNSIPADCFDASQYT